MIKRREEGAVNSWLILSLILILLSLAGAATAGWAMYRYMQEKNTVQSQIDNAVASNEKKVRTDMTNDFNQAEKSPNRLFAGPEDYGSLTFDYPKTWSVYVSQDGSAGGQYQAYLNPATVPPINTAGQQFALRVNIQTVDYSKTVATYDSYVKKGDLKSSAVKVGGEDATRLDGTFPDGLRGSIVLFKLRDKTVTVRTDANTFINDFNTLVSTIQFKS
jgi:hypothetical protein